MPHVNTHTITPLMIKYAILPDARAAGQESFVPAPTARRPFLVKRDKPSAPSAKNLLSRIRQRRRHQRQGGEKLRMGKMLILRTAYRTTFIPFRVFLVLHPQMPARATGFAHCLKLPQVTTALRAEIGVAILHFCETLRAIPNAYIDQFIKLFLRHLTHFLIHPLSIYLCDRI